MTEHIIHHRKNFRISLTVYELTDKFGNTVIVHDDLDFYDSVKEDYKGLKNVSAGVSAKGLANFLGINSFDKLSFSSGSDMVVVLDCHGNEYNVYAKDFDKCVDNTASTVEYYLKAKEIFTLSFPAIGDVLTEFNINDMESLAECHYMEQWYDNYHDLPDKVFDFIELEDYGVPSVVFRLSLQ